MLKRILILHISLIIFAAGCGTKKAIHTEDADELYERAVKELNEEGGGFPWIFNDPNYERTAEILREIQLRHTFSPYATLAELRMADLYYKQGEYEQAVVEYEAFLNRHPGHRETQHAMYFLAMSYYKLKKSPDRDPTYARKALESFREFKNRFPDYEQMNKVDNRIRKCKDILAEREIYIGNFYMREDNYKAAYERYDNVLEKFPDSKYVDEATRKMEEARENSSGEDGLI